MIEEASIKIVELVVVGRLEVEEGKELYVVVVEVKNSCLLTCSFRGNRQILAYVIESSALRVIVMMFTDGFLLDIPLRRSYVLRRCMKQKGEYQQRRPFADIPLARIPADSAVGLTGLNVSGANRTIQ